MNQASSLCASVPHQPGEKPEPATVRILTDLKAIAPGATERIEAQFSFIGLKKHRLYAGKLQFENAKIILDVECTESPDMSKGGKK